MIIDIKNGRHPVIERNLPLGESYVPNDILINDDDQQILMITGPNMSGKSALVETNGIDLPDGSVGFICASRRSKSWCRR